jgi:hypothetical protein
MTNTKLGYGRYLLVLSGSAQDAPFLKGWKTLKDSIWQNAGGPGWTDVSSTSQEDIRRGWCNFMRARNVEAAYSMRYAIITKKRFLLTLKTFQTTIRRCPKLKFAWWRGRQTVNICYYTTTAPSPFWLLLDVLTHPVVAVFVRNPERSDPRVIYCSVGLTCN